MSNPYGIDAHQNAPTPPRQIPIDGETGSDQAPATGMSGCAKVAIGCGCLTLVMIVLMVIGGYWFASNWRRVATDLAIPLIKSGIQELQLPDDQQQRITQRLDTIAEQYKEGEISDQQIARIFQNVFEGPLMPAGSARFFERVHLDPSGLDEAEKEAARTTIRRFARGAIDESIPREHTNAVLDTISQVQGPNQQRVFRESLSDDEVRAFVAAAGEAADDAGVPEDIPEINFADEWDNAIDKALEGPTPGQ